MAKKKQKWQKPDPVAEKTVQILGGIARDKHFFQRVGVIDHSGEWHTGKSDVELMDRLTAKENIGHLNRVSTFLDDRSMEAEQKKLLVENVGHIATWLHATNMPSKQPFPLKQSIPEEDEPIIGVGIKKGGRKLHHMESKRGIIVLKRVPETKENPYGFQVVTCYVDLNKDVAKATGKDLTEVMKQTKTYQNSTEARQKHLLELAGQKKDPLTEEDLKFAKSRQL